MEAMFGRALRKVPRSVASIARLEYSSSFTDRPGWMRKIKDRFSALDVDNDGIVTEHDIRSLAKKLASYRNQGEDASKRYFATFDAVYGVRKPTNEEEFVAWMKVLASKPDARDRVHGIADMVFKLMDRDENGEVSFDEFHHFHKAVSNMSEEMIRSLFTKSDLNGDGVITNSEFRKSSVTLLLSDEAY